MARYEPMTVLKLKRKEQGLNQTQLAEKAGVSQNAISQYEKGTCFPRRNVLRKLAAALGCEEKDLI